MGLEGMERQVFVGTIKRICCIGKWMEFWFKEEVDDDKRHQFCKSYMFYNLLDNELESHIANNGIRGLKIEWEGARPIRVWRETNSSSPVGDTGFKLRGYYRHPTGESIHVIGELDTTMWGETLVAESSRGRLIAVGSDAASAANWVETTEQDWMSCFNKGER